MTNEQKTILTHAVERSANKSYCGSFADPDLLALVKMGYMKGPIRAGFLPKDTAYYVVTREGVEVVGDS